MISADPDSKLTDMATGVGSTQRVNTGGISRIDSGPGGTDRRDGSRSNSPPFDCRSGRAGCSRVPAVCSRAGREDDVGTSTGTASRDGVGWACTCGRKPEQELMAVWQRMLSGRRLDLSSPSSLDIELEDIAHGLARVARWNGQTTGEWALSVAEHSLLVERIAAAYRRGLEPRWRLAALLHDGPEYVFGDMISPLKRHAGGQQAVLETLLQEAIHERFGLPRAIPGSIRKLVKRSDAAAAHVEAVQLAGYSTAEADCLWGRPRLRMLREIRLCPMSPADAAVAFERRFLELWRRIG